MKRLLSTNDLDSLISLVEKHLPESDILDYLRHSRNNKWGEGTLYAVNLDGAICTQLHKAEFENNQNTQK